MLRTSLLALLLVACDRPSPLVICHNGNCTKPDTSRDDSLPALDESLTLDSFDGIEWDTFWYGAESRCIFAHDLANDRTTPATMAAQRIADFVARWTGERFYVFIELKASVGESLTDAHTPEQRVLHAECALDARDILLATGKPVTISFVSAEPAQLHALVDRPRWIAGPDFQLVGDIFGPYSSAVPALADYDLPIDAVEFHPDYMTVQHREAYRSLGIDLVQWSFVTTPEALDSIRRWEPRYVLTNEADLLRRWIDD